MGAYMHGWHNGHLDRIQNRDYDPIRVTNENVPSDYVATYNRGYDDGWLKPKV